MRTAAKTYRAMTITIPINVATTTPSLALNLPTPAAGAWSAMMGIPAAMHKDLYQVVV